MRVLVMTHEEFEPPDSPNAAGREASPWKTEYDLFRVLGELGHRPRVLAAARDVTAIRTVIGTWRPDVVFNLLEEFRGEGMYVPYLLGYLQLLGVPFTGTNPAGLLLTDNKPLTKKVLRYHRIPVPDFALFPRGSRVRRPERLRFPLIVKSGTLHGSVGIAQKSVVESDASLEERVRHVHETLGTEAIVEEFIDGRELYVGVLGNRRLETMPIWEMHFDKLAPGAHAIATERVKWDVDYQVKRGIVVGPARKLPDGVERTLLRLSRRVFKILDLNGYARLDFRLRPDGRLYLLEANPNPDLAHDHDFAVSARDGGFPYDKLVTRILSLALRYHRKGR